MVEPSGAATVAAALSGRVAIDGPIVAIVSGGNIDMDRLDEFRRTRTASTCRAGDLRLQPHSSTMPIELFEMERMQSTWENLVDYDMSESGVRPLTLRELVGMGFDLDAFLDSRWDTASRTEPSSCANGSPRSTPAQMPTGSRSPTARRKPTTSSPSASFGLATSSRCRYRITCRCRAWHAASAASVRTFALRQETGWEPDWDEFEQAITSKTRLVYLSNPNNPSGAVLSDVAMQHIVSRVESTGSWLLSDEVYLGAEIDRPRTRSFWGMSDRVIVTSGLSKAYGIPGVRIGWIVAPKQLTAECWTQHDYLTIGPNKMSDRIARVAVEDREPRDMLRTDAIDSRAQPANRARMDRRVQRPPHLARTTGRGDRAGPV